MSIVDIKKTKPLLRFVYTIHSKRDIKLDDYRVYLNINSIEDVLQTYSIRKYPVLSYELLDYINRETKNVKLGQGVVFSIKSINIAIKEELQKLLQEDCIKQISIIDHDSKKMKRSSMVFSIIGILIFALKAILDSILNINLLNELLIIACWVFLWKAIEINFFERNKLKIEKVRIIRVYMAKYEMVD